jgi:hypothetical protein
MANVAFKIMDIVFISLTIWLKWRAANDKKKAQREGIDPREISLDGRLYVPNSFEPL